MSSKNIAIVFAPNTLRPEIETPTTMMADATPKISVMAFLIDLHKTIFPDKLVLKTKSAPSPLSLSEMMDFVGGESSSPMSEEVSPLSPFPSSTTTSTATSTTKKPSSGSPRSSLIISRPPPIPARKHNDALPTSQTFAFGTAGIPPPPSTPTNNMTTSSSSSVSSSNPALLPSSTSFNTSTPVSKKNQPVTDKTSNPLLPPPPPPPPPPGSTGSDSTLRPPGSGHKRVVQKTLPTKVNIS